MTSDGTAGAPSRLGTSLTGRAAPWAALRNALLAAPVEGRALWLRGEAGIGKTALLDQAVSFASEQGMRVLRAAGTAPESGVAFGVLRRLVQPLLDRQDVLTASLRHCLEEAAAGAPPAGPAVAAATLALLSGIADEQPLLLAVDNLPWVDAPSAGVLAFLQRRLTAAPLVLICALRAEDASGLDTTGAEVWDLAPLTPAESAAVLRHRRPDLPAKTRARLVREAVGNPLALVGSAAGPGCSPDACQVSAPTALSPGEQLEHDFALRLNALPPGTRFLLLLHALAGHEERSIRLALEAADAAGAAASENTLVTAERSGLVRLQHARLTFLHPLVRTSLVRTASSPDLRRAHAALAAVLPHDDERRATHLASAVAGTDDGVADHLVEVARRTIRRGGHHEAATLLERAARLSARPETRGARLTAAANAAAIGGQPAIAARLLAEAEANGVAADSRPLWELTDAYVRFEVDGDYSPAAARLPTLLARLPACTTTADDAVPETLHFLLHLTAAFSGDPALQDALRAELPFHGAVARFCFDLWNRPARQAPGDTRRLRRLIAALSPEEETQQAWQLLWIAAALDCVGEHAQLWHRVVQQAPYLTQAHVSLATCGDDYLRGRWDRCISVSRQGANTAREQGCGFHARLFRLTEASAHAARGRQTDAEAVLERIEPWARERGQSYVLRRITGIRAVLALSLGEDETAYSLAALLTPPGTFAEQEPHAPHMFLTLVEAAVRTGRRAEALRHVAAGHAIGMGDVGPRHAFLLAAAEAMAAEGEDVHTLSEAAYAMPGADAWPFELARLHLRHGVWLRLAHRPEQARPHLLTAHTHFTRLKAEAWELRAAEELRAAGTVVARARPTEVWRLSPQELRIARLVASGLSNGQIAERLKVSPRTVGTHLYKIFPKVNVASRAALAHAVREAYAP
ncbi:helix-turn-helix transcriptional regulator [Streptomyces roseolus]|uniref:helix-turn-helix transcriptional regulator n=1 Tax=Streptomyces roseolus TaxID=67358 RepID=UPI0016788E9B|nr:LuxR family transcriptional regulator [Streptomyces roseolus]GGR20335.1 LuxR family transcriptional regulator [Streptomyces roseolus]